MNKLEFLKRHWKRLSIAAAVLLFYAAAWWLASRGFGHRETVSQWRMGAMEVCAHTYAPTLANAGSIWSGASGIEWAGGGGSHSWGLLNAVTEAGQTGRWEWHAWSRMKFDRKDEGEWVIYRIKIGDRYFPH